MNEYNRSKFQEAYLVSFEFGTRRPLTEDELDQLIMSIELQITEPQPLENSDSKRAKWDGTFITYPMPKKLENVNRWKVIPMDEFGHCKECRTNARDCECVYCPQCEAISYEITNECQYCEESMLDPMEFFL